MQNHWVLSSKLGAHLSRPVQLGNASAPVPRRCCKEQQRSTSALGIAAVAGNMMQPAHRSQRTLFVPFCLKLACGFKMAWRRMGKKPKACLENKFGPTFGLTTSKKAGVASHWLATCRRKQRSDSKRMITAVHGLQNM